MFYLNILVMEENNDFQKTNEESKKKKKTEVLIGEIMLKLSFVVVVVVLTFKLVSWAIPYYGVDELLNNDLSHTPLWVVGIVVFIVILLARKRI